MDKAKLKALVLVGGFGTRLRPFTLSKAKPLVEFANKAILSHQIEALIKVGVTEIILAINYQPDRMMDYIQQAEKTYGVKILCSKEDVPLNTAGPIGLAAANGLLDGAEDFFVLNSDIICSYPFENMLKFHRKHGKEATILVTPVEEPSRYGVILSDENSKITQFIEKPQKYVGNRINAGIYILNKQTLKRIRPEPISIEREVFPAIANDNQLYSFDLPGFWMDVGLPKDYLLGTSLYLDHLSKHDKSRLVTGANIKGNVFADSTAQIHPDAVVGPNVVLGPGVKVEAGARILNSVLFERVSVDSYSFIDGGILGWGAKIGKWVRIERLTLLGEDVVIANELMIDGAIVLPNVGVKTSIKKQDQIVMY